MTLRLLGHPFSSYTMKALVPLYENGTAFTFREIAPGDPDAAAELARVSPLAKFPVLIDGETVVVESTSIIEYLDLRHPGPMPMIPVATDAAILVRTLDRLFDNYVMAPMQAIVSEALRPDEAGRDPWAVAQARGALDRAYAWLDRELDGRVWAAGESFSLADCAAAPALLYAQWVHPIPAALATLAGYRARLLARPSMARCLDEARPYRAFFPLPVPADD